MRRSTLLTLAGAAAFLGLLFWSMLSAQKVECSACVTFNGRSNCASASALTEEEALKAAVSTACGILARGMDASNRCSNLAPERPQCRTR